MSKPDPTPNPGSDAWDAALDQLLREHGVDPDRNRPLTKAQRRRRYVRKARGTMAATVAAVVASWVVVRSGAPAAAFVPLASWLFFYIGRGYWKAADSPSWRQLAEVAQRHGKRGVLLIVRWLGRTVWYPITRAIRVRTRARRLAAAQ
ncbi:hypothetical protein AB0M12_41740 [Nocardia vinacea]|uniref:hypothetical protein n=1 Tax=Nocardia vinacea TaxID=96468 RepID=UPI00343F7CC2